ncbi:MAG: YggT family protein [Gaiellales bacterium]|jgi:YggT family protein|nr:YggT family protein [Gaiellales bacterium]
MDFGRDLVALFINSLTLVYTVMIIAYALQTFVPIGFSAPVMAVRRFLDDTVAPYLMIFRRFIRPLGPLDLSAMVAIFALWIVSQIVQGIIAA